MWPEPVRSQVFCSPNQVPLLPGQHNSCCVQAPILLQGGMCCWWFTSVMPFSEDLQSSLDKGLSGCVLKRRMCSGPHSAYTVGQMGGPKCRGQLRAFKISKQRNNEKRLIGLLCRMNVSIVLLTRVRILMIRIDLFLIGLETFLLLHLEKIGCPLI